MGDAQRLLDTTTRSLALTLLSLVLEEQPSTLGLLFPFSESFNAFKTKAGQTSSSCSLTKIIPATLKLPTYQRRKLSSWTAVFQHGS